MTESVWDYPRPPAVVTDDRRVRIELGGVLICDTTDAVRVLETSHPPTWYVPRDALRALTVQPLARTTLCEFKGRASYGDLRAGDRTARAAAWWYEQPAPGYELLLDRLAVYPSRMDRCLVDDEVVQPQEGDFYGGWITREVTGPFKGGAGTLGW